MTKKHDIVFNLTIDDLKVDVFGMGTIAFYLLTGVPNFTIF